MARGLSSAVALLAVTAAALAVGAPRCAAQTPSSSAGCTASIVSLLPCLSFTTGTSSAPPSSACCSALASVVRGSPRCLCAVLGGGAAASLGVTVNATRALALPGQCRVQTPPVSQCNDVVGAPTAATPASASPPAPAPIAEAPTAPDFSTAGAGSKQQAAPATGAVSSHAGVTQSTAVSVPLVVAVALMMALL